MSMTNYSKRRYNPDARKLQVCARSEVVREMELVVLVWNTFSVSEAGMPTSHLISETEQALKARNLKWARNTPVVDLAKQVLGGK
jgi:hypothetical protein